MESNITKQEFDVAATGGVLGDCALCDDKNVLLKESHCIPKFAYDWLKKTSATQFIRDTRDVNVRHQDGPKKHLLCGGCEGKLSVWEKKLAEGLFRKIANYQKQSSILVISDEIQLAVLSVFWRALLTTNDDENNRTSEDKVVVDAFLDASKQDILNNRCSTTIYFAPFYGEPPFYGLPKAYTYGIDRSIGSQDIRFTDHPHRYFAVFKLPFMYFYILSPGWPYEETSPATKLEVGELDVGKIQEVPGILKLYIKRGYEEFLKSKAAMDEVNQEQIRREVEKSGGKITGSDKSLRRSGQ
ncbi:hypothetical protein [Pseudomonas sp. B21-035]|uniref:hypothetical protein n=1 Tax=Pseudomonas sp. B21-035 TaxID=2895484 RepID=UPI00215E8B23|nr:hypothetical protein [Pseudomonas sp. B21-035]UVL58837.1 hypothetical protein LOY22_12945 [Pseudomonas sp. B21-035]